MTWLWQKTVHARSPLRRAAAARVALRTLADRSDDLQQAGDALGAKGDHHRIVLQPALLLRSLQSRRLSLLERFTCHLTLVVVVTTVVLNGGFREQSTSTVARSSDVVVTKGMLTSEWQGEMVRALAPSNSTFDVSDIGRSAPILRPPPIVASPIFARSHTLQAGDTLGAIATAHGITVESLIWANGLQDGDVVAIGRELRIPRISGVPHTVASDETIDAIAARYGVAIESIELLAENGIRPGVALAPGTEIFVPGGRVELSPQLMERYGSVEQLAVLAAQPAGSVRETQTNVRSGPGRAYPRLYQLDQGAWIVPVARYKGWIKIDSAGESGWVLAELIALPAGLPETLPETHDFPPPPPIWVWPARGVLTSGFGPRWGTLHNGIDIANRAWTPIVAARAGHVFEAGWCRGFGYCVKIDHGDGIQTIYGHLVAKPPVQVGEEVAAGQLIGAMGSTYDAGGGGYSTGVHLHFTVKVGGRAVDPLKYLP